MAGDRTPSADWVTLDDLERDPHPTLARLRADHPVAWVPALGMWMITSRALALAAMQDFEGLTVDDPRFSTGQVVGPSMLSLDGPEHTRHRSPFVGPFRFSTIDAGFTEAVSGFVADLLDRAEQNASDVGRVELRTALAAPLATRTMMLALGLDTAAEATILAWYASIVQAVTEITKGNPLPDSGRAAYTSLAAAIAPNDTALNDTEVAANAAVLLFGGIETTEGMIANLLHHLLTEPGMLAAVRAEPELLDACIEESLRLEPAAAVVDRYATRDVSIGGVVIPAGDPVTISLAGANRDPATFADPDRFHPGRNALRQHLTFAAGPHVCLGAHLARLETRLLVRGLLQRFAQIDSVAEASDPPRGLVFRKPNCITVRLSRM
jgi:cytochrome P450